MVRPLVNVYERSCLTYDGDGASFGHVIHILHRRLRRRVREQNDKSLSLIS